MVVVLLATTSAWAASPPRLNVVFILTDNLGYADLGCYGARDIRTPNIDRLASEGVRFTQFYSNAPDCTPSRTALLTGRYQHRVGGLECAIGIGNVGRYEDAIRLAKQHDLGLPASETTIVRLLKQAGYQCVGFGKWHLGYEKKFLPPAHGFDYYLGLLSGCEDYFYHRDPSGAPVLFENNQVVTREGYTTDLFTDKAVEFITAQGRKKPFFLYLPYLNGDKTGAPHDALFWRCRTRSNNFAARQGDWKMVWSTEGAAEPGPNQKPARFMLFNLAEDLSEQNDLAAKHPDKLAALRKLWEAWSASVDTDCRKLGIKPKMEDLSLKPAPKRQAKKSSK
jgi:arylsulfatase A-like enzyme